MLARLDEAIAPLRASVNREGNLLRIEGADAQPEIASRVLGIVEDLGSIAQPLADAPPVPRWFGSAEVDELSIEEAGVLADRWIEDLAAEAVIDDPPRIREPLRAALLDTFREAARTGVIGEPWVADDALRTVLNAGEAEAVRRWIDGKLGRIIASHERAPGES